MLLKGDAPSPSARPRHSTGYRAQAALRWRHAEAAASPASCWLATRFRFGGGAAVARASTPASRQSRRGQASAAAPADADHTDAQLCRLRHYRCPLPPAPRQPMPPASDRRDKPRRSCPLPWRHRRRELPLLGSGQAHPDGCFRRRCALYFEGVVVDNHADEHRRQARHNTGYRRQEDAA